MALYEYLCDTCHTRFEKRMPMTDVLQLVPCPRCKGQARKLIGSFAVLGRAEASLSDGPAPWESGDEGAGGENEHGHDHGHSHGHSHAPGGGHSHGFDDLDF